MKFQNTYDLLPERFFAEASPATFSKPSLLAFNEKLAADLGPDLKGHSPETLARIFSGQELLEGFHPIAMANAAHQFAEI